MARILFSAKDNGCASVTERVAVLARDEGHKIFTALEGLATARYEKLGLPVYEPHNYVGAVNFKEPSCPAERYAVRNFSAEELLDKVRPDIVVTGVGSPINIQRDIAEEATRREIPLVVCEDFWAKSPGHFNPEKVKPAMILAVDEVAATLIRKNGFQNTPVHIVGNPGAKRMDITKEVRDQMKIIFSEGFGFVIVFAGGGPESTTAELALLIECLKKTPGNWCLVPRFHPKHANTKVPDAEKTYVELWQEFLAPVGERVRYVEAPSTDPVASAADLVVSGFSTLLTTAVYNYTPAVCLKTPETMCALRTHGKHYTEIPQVALGVVSEVTEPANLFDFGLPPLNLIEKIVPYNPENAYGHIKALLR